MLQAIDHINIVVEDLEKAKEFFLELGFLLEHEDELKGEWISRVVGLPNVSARYAKLVLPNDNCRLELVSYFSPPVLEETSPNQANTQGYRHIAFRVENIEVVEKKLKEMRLELFSEVEQYPPTKKKLLYFRGPENIILELAEYGS